MTKKTIKWWIYKNHGWNCLGGEQARKIIKTYTKPKGYFHHHIDEIISFNQWMDLYHQFRTCVTTSDIRIWTQTGPLLSAYYDHNTYY